MIMNTDQSLPDPVDALDTSATARPSETKPELALDQRNASAIPPPHLPLRRKITESLRLRSPTIRRSQKLQTTPPRKKESRISTEPVSPLTKSPVRPKTAHDEAGDVVPPLRPSMSIPDLPKRDEVALKSARSTFWRDGGVQFYRESIMSSSNTNTSVVNTSESSVWTARSSQSTAESQMDWKEEEMDLDDYIGLYEEGFDDPPERPLSDVPVIPTTLDDLNAIRSARLAPVEFRDPFDSPTDTKSNESNDTSKTETIPPPVTVEPESTPPVPDGPLLQSEPERAEPVPRDCYGFKQRSHHYTEAQYDSWHKDYKNYLDRRKRKWTYLMNTHGILNHIVPETFPPRSPNVKRYIRKGIPPEWRGAAWFHYGGGAEFLKSNHGLYNCLLEGVEQEEVPEQDRDHIERDLQRTFPDNIYFKPDGSAEVETDMIKSLRRILHAYALYRPKVGYCQSLNFLAGFLLLFMRLSFENKNHEERAFALLCILTDKYLPGTHGVVLEGCNVDIGVLMAILQETMPALWTKLDDHAPAPNRFSRRKSSMRSMLRTGTEGLPTVSLATTAWFMSCFVLTLPIESVCRVWDCIWYEGSKTIFRVALAIFRLCEKPIRACTDPMEVFQIVQSYPRALLDANELITIATMKSSVRLGVNVPGFGGLSQKVVEARREERRLFAKKEREAALAVLTPASRPPTSRADVVSGLIEADGKSSLAMWRAEGAIAALPPVPDQATMQSALRRSATLGKLRKRKSTKSLKR